jgi:hypothetical protein
VGIPDTVDVAAMMRNKRDKGGGDGIYPTHMTDQCRHTVGTVLGFKIRIVILLEIMTMISNMDMLTGASTLLVGLVVSLAMM